MKTVFPPNVYAMQNGSQKRDAGYQQFKTAVRAAQYRRGLSSGRRGKLDLSVTREKIDLNAYKYDRKFSGRLVKKTGKKYMIVCEKHPKQKYIIFSANKF